MKSNDATGILPDEGEGDFEVELRCRGCEFVYRQRFKVAPTRAQLERLRKIGEAHERGTGHEVTS